MTAGSDYSEVIAVDVALRRGAFSLEAAFTAGLGLTALFGRSGSGKTTLIDLIAGLATPDRGRIAVAGHVLVDRRARLSVAQNLAYGRVFARLPHDPAEFDAVTGMLGIGPLLARQPAGLSGGERQRVAIGRALLARPRLLLMDEPLAALDEGRKAEILPYIERLRDEAGVPIVYVSHSVAEVARLAGTIVVLDAGRVAATGPAEEILRRADLIPLHGEPGALLDMIVEGRDPRTGLTRLTGQAGMLLVPDLARPKGATVRVRIPARDVLVATEAPQGLSARNTLPGRVLALASAGTGVLVEIDCAGAILTAQLTEAAVRDLGLVPGREVVAIIKSAAFDPAGFGTGRPTIAI